MRRCPRCGNNRTICAISDLFNGPWGAARAPDPDRRLHLRAAENKAAPIPAWSSRIRPGVNGMSSRRPTTITATEGPVEVTVSASAVGRRLSPAAGVFPAVVHDARCIGHAPGTGRTIPPPRPDDAAAVATWLWQRNPFVGTRPYQGLAGHPPGIQQLRSQELEQLGLRRSSSRRPRRAVVCRPRSGERRSARAARLGPTRNDPDRFERAELHHRRSGDGFVTFSYHGWHPELFRSRIAPADARVGEPLCCPG